MGKILIIDNEPVFCRDFDALVRGMGHECACIHTLKDAFSLLKRKEFDVIFIDREFPDGDGIRCIETILEHSSLADIVVLTAGGDVESVEQALSLGAKEYLLKPIRKDTLMSVIDYLVGQKSKTKSNSIALRGIHDTIIGDSPLMQRSLNKLAIAAQGNSSVLLTGETGTGKEVYARALHQNSARHNERFVVVDCTNLPDNLAESLLFGHEKGAFTGAHERKDGLFKLADNGTIFLDEIGDLNSTIQKSLLRVLQEKTFRPLSSNFEVRSDFRLVAATNRDLQKMVVEGTFRKDLYYRIQSFVIDLPPLRRRNGDVERLVLYYIKKLHEDNGTKFKSCTNEFLEALCCYSWPGNVRELVNCLYESLHMASFDEVLNYCHLPIEIKRNYLKRQISSDNSCNKSECSIPAFDYSLGGNQLPKLKTLRREVVDDFEFKYMSRLVQKSQFSTKKACTMSGLSRTRLYELLNKHRIQFKRFH